MRRVLPLKIALASLLIAACVTINVYFPAAAADKAAAPAGAATAPGNNEPNKADAKGAAPGTDDKAAAPAPAGKKGGKKKK